MRLWIIGNVSQIHHHIIPVQIMLNRITERTRVRRNKRLIRITIVGNIKINFTNYTNNANNRTDNE